MDIKAEIEEIVKKLQNDKTLAEDFKKDPIKAVEKLLGVDLPDDTIKKIVDGVKAALAGSQLSGALDKLKKIF